MHPNAALIQRGFDAFATGDMATLAELFHPDAVWVSESGGIVGGKFEGRDAIFATFARIPQETVGTFAQAVTEIFADDRVAVALATLSGTRRGQSLDGARQAIVFVIRDNQVVEARVISLDPDRTNAFWAE